MSLFLAQAAYTGESWKMKLENQQNVQQRINPLVKELGGNLVGAFYAFGEYDIVLLMEMPSEEAAAAFALAVSAGGSVSVLKTTPLLTIEARNGCHEAGRRCGGHLYDADSSVRISLIL